MIDNGARRAPDGDELARAISRVERELGALLRRARGISAHIARDVHPDLDASAYGILLCVATGEATSVTELAVALGIGKPTVSRQVSALEELGLIRREPAPDDRRASRLQLTDEGATRFGAARAARRKALRALLAQWPRADIDAFGRLLGRFNELAL